MTMDLFKDAKEEVSITRFPKEDTRIGLFDTLDRIQKAVLESLMSKGTGTVSSRFINPVDLEKINGLAILLENLGCNTVSSASKETMISETERLINDVEHWDIDDYAKKTLVMQLNNITRIVQYSDRHSDSDLRLHVKGVIADFVADFGDLDKKHQKYLERMLDWSKAGFFAGTFCLGLTADVITTTLALPSPAPQIEMQ